MDQNKPEPQDQKIDCYCKQCLLEKLGPDANQRLLIGLANLVGPANQRNAVVLPERGWRIVDMF